MIKSWALLKWYLSFSMVALSVLEYVYCSNADFEGYPGMTILTYRCIVRDVPSVGVTVRVLLYNRRSHADVRILYRKCCSELRMSFFLLG
jgi:hypothetical protein